MTRTYLLATLVGALAVAAPGCGDSTECGPNTVEVDGTCVLADLCPTGQAWNDDTSQCVTITVCATGTVDDGSGNCIPDFSIICTGNTVLDAATGECIVDAAACGTDTTLVDGECITVDDSLVADVNEPAEPNGLNAGDVQGTFDLPTNEGDTVTIKVNTNPFEDVDSDGILDPDLDVFFATATGAGRYMVRVDALNGGGVGGFLALGLGGNLEDWRRFGISNTQDWIEREIFLPEAGSYAFAFGDSRGILTGFGNGSPDSDMFITITKMADPVPTALTMSATHGDHLATGNADGSVQCYNTTGNAYDMIFSSLEQDAAIDSLNLGMVILADGVLITDLEEGDGGVAATPSAPATPNILVCIDPIWNYGFPVGNSSYVGTISTVIAAALPDDGSTVSVPFVDNSWSFGHFDGEADTVHRFVMDSPSGDNIDMIIFDPDFNVLLNMSGETAIDEFLWLKATGVYYVYMFNNAGVDGTPYDLDFTRATIAPTTITMGTPITGQVLSTTHGRDFYMVDFSASEWFEVGGTLTNFGGDLSFGLYNPANAGVLDDGVNAVETILAATGTYEGRVNLGAGGLGQLLVSVTDDNGADGDESYDLDVRERAHNTYPITIATPISEVIALMADATGYFLITGAPADVAEMQLTATADGGSAAYMEVVDREGGTLQSTTDGVQISALFTGGWLAGFVEEDVGTATNVTLSGTGVAPQLVSIVGDAGTTLVAMSDDDDGLSTAGYTLPFAFNIGSTAVTEFTVDSNGRLVFVVDFFDTGGSDFSPADIPSASNVSPFIAPHWADMASMQIYIKSEATQVTVEFVGTYWNSSTPTHAQLIIYDDNTVDFIIGADHVDTCASVLGIQEDDTTGLALTDGGVCNASSAPNALTTVNAATLAIVP